MDRIIFAIVVLLVHLAAFLFIKHAEKRIEAERKLTKRANYSDKT